MKLKKIARSGLLVVMMFCCGLMMVPSEVNARSMEFQGVNPDGYDPNYPGLSDYNKTLYYWWKTSCSLIMGSFSEDTWRCSLESHLPHNAAERTDDKFAAYGDLLYPKAVRENWVNPGAYRSKGKLEGVLLCNGDNGAFWDPFFKEEPCRLQGWSVDESYCMASNIAGLEVNDFIWNRRTHKCYSESNPCIEVYIGWADDAPSEAEMKKKREVCEAKNGTGSASGTSSTSGAGGNESQYGPDNPKERDNQCVSTATMGEVCDTGEDGTGPINDIVDTVVTATSFGVGIAGVTGFTVTGIQYMMAAGNEELMRKSKRRMAEIVIGVAGYALIWALMNWLTPGGL